MGWLYGKVAAIGSSLLLCVPRLQSIRHSSHIKNGVKAMAVSADNEPSKCLVFPWQESCNIRYVCPRLGVGFELFESPGGIILEASSIPEDEVELAKPFHRKNVTVTFHWPWCTSLDSTHLVYINPQCWVFEMLSILPATLANRNHFYKKDS